MQLIQIAYMFSETDSKIMREIPTILRENNGDEKTAPHPNSLSEKGIEKTHLKEMGLTRATTSSRRSRDAR